MAIQQNFEEQHLSLLFFLIEYIRDLVEEDVKRTKCAPSELHCSLVTIDLIAASMVKSGYNKEKMMASLRGKSFIGHSPEVAIDATLIFDEVLSRVRETPTQWEDEE